MPFAILGTAFRELPPGVASVDHVSVSASTFGKRPIVYVTRPAGVEGEQSIGMAPEQARQVAAWLLDAAAWAEERRRGS